MSVLTSFPDAASALSLMSGLTQDARLLRLTTPLGADVLVAECVRGEEGLSQGFQFRIAALSTDAAISLKSLIGQPVLLELLTTAGRDALRPFHGHVTTVELTGANGGLARYQLTIEPWSAFLSHGRDSRIFQDMTTPDILDAVFAGYSGKGKLVPAWRFDLQDRDVYPKRSVTTQYLESDLAFAQRLMHEEGLFYYFEHAGQADTPALGTHTMVIADHNGAFEGDRQGSIAFSQPGATMRQDTFDRWRTELRLQPNAVELVSWDYRSLDTRPVNAASTPGAGQAELTTRDVPGAYAYPSRAQGQRIAERQLQAFEANKEIHVGAGTVRTLRPGTLFTLTGQATLDTAASDDERSFVVVRVVHLMHNNLSAEMRTDINARLGVGLLTAAIDQEQRTSLHATGKTIGQRPTYRNRIDAIRSKVPYRSSGRDEHGCVLHPRPTVMGQQTAIVVGPPGTAIHTDRDHRVKVQFHWQRGVRSHNRLAHPQPDGHTGAPGDDGASTWVRVATPMAPVAGANWGSSALPRVGQEVIVDFLDGNIDRPVVIGALYNGRGQVDAQHNQVASGAGAATGNAPAWFAGQAGGHAHPAVLSGFKTQALGASQSGSGAYSQLVLDDSPGQARVSLQHHANAHQGTAELNLGHLVHQADNQRLAAAGFGAELKTEHSVAMRAGKGLLLSTDARGSAAGTQLDSHEAVTQIEESLQLQTDLAELASKHNGTGSGAAAGAGTGTAAGASTLRVSDAMARSRDALQGKTSGGAAPQPQSTGVTEAGAEPGYAQPQMQLSSPAGIAATTPMHAIFTAGMTSALNAGHDINLAAQGNTFAAVKNGITLFTYGKTTAGDKPNQETGIRLHAASGKVSSTSATAETRLTADKAITVASVTASVNIKAKQHVLLNAQGAQLKLEGGNIELFSPKKVEFKASMKELTGPHDASTGLPALSKPAEIFNEAFVVRNEKTGEIMAHVPYRMESASGVVLEGITDSMGRTQRLFTPKPEDIQLFLKDQD